MSEIYRGELRKKLPRKNEAKKLAAVLREDPEGLRALIREEIEAQHKKLPALFKHFGIEPGLDFDDAYFELAMRLAEAHVPGFQYEQARGAPRKWDHRKRVKAAIELGKLQHHHPDKSDNYLASILHKQLPWSSMSKTPGALLKQIRLLNQEEAAIKLVLQETSSTNRLVSLLTRGN